MVLSKRVGTILKEAREARKLSTKDVSRETNMPSRFIEALEAEDYTQFPGETYALGFLRNYSDYLGLDTEQLLNLYRGVQIDQSRVPLKELTKSTKPIIPAIDPKFMYIGAGVVAVVVLIALFLTGVIPSPIKMFSRPGSVASVCSNREIVAVALPQVDSVPRVENLSLENTLKLPVDGLNVKLCLEKIDRGATIPIAYMLVRVNDEKDYHFQASEGETVNLNQKIKELAAYAREFKITFRVLGDISARIQVEAPAVAVIPDATGQPAQQPNAVQPPPVATPPSVIAALQQKDIQVTLQFSEDSFFEWTNDGNYHPGSTIAAGESRTLQAKDRLIIKVGNGGGVKIIRNGTQRLAGPAGKIVVITYARIPNPLDPGQSQIQENIAVQ